MSVRSGFSSFWDYNPVIIESLLVKFKDCTLRGEKSDVYRLDGDDSQGIHIGETSRQLKIKVAEHVESWETGYI